MKIVQVPILPENQNISYLLIDEKEKIAAAVDPADPKTVIAAAKKEGVKITTVLTTHHHWDHAGGNKEMGDTIPGLKIFGGSEKVQAATNFVKDQQEIDIGSIKVKAHYTPCHTRDHILYEATDSTDNTKPLALFTGDTLFIGGCGRFFEGTADEMYHALCKVVAGLPDTTEIYCGHEYTVKNLEFAITVEPNNKELKEKLAWAKNQRADNLSTVPSTVAGEKSFNPFMRVGQKSIADAVGMSGEDPVQVMKALRQMKDKW